MTPETAAAEMNAALAPTNRQALEAIARMKIDETTNYKELAALAIVIARTQLQFGKAG